MLHLQNYLLVMISNVEMTTSVTFSAHRKDAKDFSHCTCVKEKNKSARNQVERQGCIRTGSGPMVGAQ